MTTRRRIRWLLPGVLALVTFLGAGVPRASAQADELFRPGEVQEIRLIIHSRDVQRLRERYLENTFYPADLLWSDRRVRNVAVRSRGLGTRNPWKPGLLVEFDRYVEGQRFGGRRAIVLDNLWQDPSMVRESVTMALFARMGQPAMLESYCRLYVNGDYQGVYALVESVDEEFLARVFGDRAGVLHEYHWIRPYYFEDLGDDFSTYEPLFEPRTQRGTSMPFLFGPLRDMVRAINQPLNSLWRSGVEQHVDVRQLLTHTAIETFVSELDGILGYAGLNNFYLYRPANAARHVFLPWDRDNAFQQVDASIFRRVNENILIRRLLTYPDLYAFYLDALEQTARVASSGGWLAGVIASTAALINAPAAADVHAPPTAAERAGATAYLLDFARRRPEIVLDQVRRARAVPALAP